MRRAPVLAVVALITAGVAATLAVMRRATAEDVPAAAAPAEPREWHCACGQGFRVSGEDRHRVLWPDGAGPADAVLDDRCPACERALSAQD